MPEICPQEYQEKLFVGKYLNGSVLLLDPLEQWGTVHGAESCKSLGTGEATDAAATCPASTLEPRKTLPSISPQHPLPTKVNIMPTGRKEAEFRFISTEWAVKDILGGERQPTTN